MLALFLEYVLFERKYILGVFHYILEFAVDIVTINMYLCRVV